MNTKTLDGRCALITGSIEGLGFAIANALAAQGAHIVLHGLEDIDQALAAREKLAREHGVDVIVSRADLSQTAGVESLMHQALNQFGTVDIVVNNAVVRHFAAAHELPVADWDLALAVNLSAAFHTARLALPGMLAKGWGRIINLSSVYGAGGATNRIGYVTTKTALIGMTRALALETATHGITCNAVSPGTVPTPAITSRIARLADQAGVSIEQAEHDYLAERQPTGRFVGMESVGALVAFLCGPAGADITGAVLPIDGGWTAG